MSKQPAIIVDNVSMKFNLSKEKVDSLKDYIIKSIKKEIKYNEFWALQNVSFTVEKGDRVGILGLNGAGKSTLLKVIAGVFKPTEGSVTKHGKMVPLLELGAGFDQQYTGKENIYLYGAMLGYSKEFIDEKYDEIVKFSELKDFIDVPIKNYSSGMKSRLGFSIATVVSPKILILDEGILGLNGAGKSTLLKVIAGVFKPTEGSVTKHGKMVPLLELGAGFDQQYTGKENIYLYGAMLGYSKEFIDEKYDEIVKFSELKDFIDVPIKNYSSGMKSRLGFSIATVVSPKILILDEVLSVGDAKFRKKSEKKVLSMFDSGVTVLFVSHSLAQVQRICNKAMILEKGKLIAYGDIDTISEQYEKMTN